MAKLALLARLEARPGKEQEVTDFLTGGLPLANQEWDTISWYAWQTGPSTFGAFITFDAEDGRDAHLRIAAAFTENADRLSSKPPVIEKLTILAAKG
jgi:hypothetical protein